MSHADLGVSSAVNPHCDHHSHFEQSCEQCHRAKAAFQPYHLIGKAEPPTRSFQNGNPLIIAEPLSGADLTKIVVAKAVTESLVDRLLYFFSSF